MAIVSYKIDELPNLTAEETSQMQQSFSCDGDEIDFSDIPKTDENFWKNAQRGNFFDPKFIAQRKALAEEHQQKFLSSLNLDADILQWLKNKHQNLNSIFRKIMQIEKIMAEN